MATLNERVARHDREIAAIRKLVHTGMKMLVRMEERFEIETAVAREEMRQIRLAQRETDRQLQMLQGTVDRLVRSIERGEGNGHKSKPIK